MPDDQQDTQQMMVLWGPPARAPQATPEQQKERWLRSRGVEVGQVVRVLPATERDPEEILYLSDQGEPETAYVFEDWSISLDAGW